MKHKKVLIVGIIWLVLLIAADFFQLYLYHERSSRNLDSCLTRSAGSNEARNCFPIQSAADAAFSSATSNHIPTYLIIFLTFTIVGSRLDRAEKRMEELESRRDA
jgi:hypothetical protein